MSESTQSAAKIVNKKEIADFLGVTTRTIDNLMRDKVLPYWKIGKFCRFDLAQVRRAMDERCGRNLQS